MKKTNQKTCNKRRLIEYSNSQMTRRRGKEIYGFQLVVKRLNQKAFLGLGFGRTRRIRTEEGDEYMYIHYIRSVYSGAWFGSRFTTDSTRYPKARS